MLFVSSSHLISQLHQAISKKIEQHTRREIRVGHPIRNPRHDEKHEPTSHHLLCSRTQENAHVPPELIRVGPRHVRRRARVVDPARVGHPLRLLGKPLESVGRVGQSDGGAGEKAAVEGAWHPGCIVLWWAREGGEEGVEIIGGLIVEEYLEFKMFGVEAPLQRALVLECLNQIINSEECVWPNGAPQICYRQCGGV